MKQPWELTERELTKCAELLELIVRPGDHDIYKPIQEALELFGYPVWEVKKAHHRSFYGIHKPTKK